MDKDQMIGFIGLGQMGKPMAANLLAAGYRLRAYNRSAGRVQELGAAGVTPAAKPVEAAVPGGIVVTMIANDQALEEVVQGMGGFGEVLGEGGVHLSMSTVAPATARRLAAYHADRGSAYVAAPVFGRPEAAAAGDLFVVAAGEPQAIEAAMPLFEAVGQKTFVVSRTPSIAHLVKLSGNFLIASVIESLGEALALVGKAGVDPHAFIEVLTSSLFNVPLYRNYGALLADRRFEPAGFAAPLGYKDIRLVLDAADALRVPLPFAAVLRDRFLALLAQGGEGLDWSAIGRLAAADAGLGRD